MLALLALLKGKKMETKQNRFNVYSKVVCKIFQVVLRVLVCIHMLVVLDYFLFALHLCCALQLHVK